MLWAASNGYFEVVKYLVGQGASLTATYSLNDYTALHYAAYMGRLEMVKYLVGAGADVNATAGGDTPHSLAVAVGETAVAEYLYPFTPRGRLESAGFAFTTQAFVEAAAEGNASAVSLFVQAGMDKEGQALVIVAGNGRERTALHAAAAGGHLAVVTYLVNAGASVSSTDGSGGTALHAAVGSGNLAIVKLLLSNGAAINAKDSYSETPLYHAAAYGHLAIVSYLRGRPGVDITIFSNDGLMPYGVARLLGHTAVMTELRGLMHYEFGRAAWLCSLESVKSFVASGMSVEYTPALYEAARAGCVAVVQYFVDQGVNIDGKVHGYRRTGRTMLHVAAGGGSIGTGVLHLLKWLVDAGASLTATDNDGKTALHTAARWGRLEEVKYLVGAGASLTATDNDGKTPRDLAAGCSTSDGEGKVRRARCAAVVSYFDSLDADADE